MTEWGDCLKWSSNWTLLLHRAAKSIYATHCADIPLLRSSHSSLFPFSLANAPLIVMAFLRVFKCSSETLDTTLTNTKRIFITYTGLSVCLCVFTMKVNGSTLNTLFLSIEHFPPFVLMSVCICITRSTQLKIIIRYLCVCQLSHHHGDLSSLAPDASFYLC